MKVLKTFTFFVLGLFALVYTSCDLEPLNDLENADFESNMEFAAPLLKASLTLQELLPDTTNSVDLYVDANDIIHVKYTGDRLEYGAEDLLSEIPLFVFPFDSIATDTILNWEVPQDDFTDFNINLRLADFTPTDITYFIDPGNPVNFTMDMEVEIYSLIDDGNVFSVNIPAGSSPLGNFTLTDPTVYMDSVRMRAVGILPDGSRVKAPISFFITSPEINYIEATIYKNLLQGQADSVTISLVEEIIGAGDINFTDPIVTFYLENSFGFSLTGFSEFYMRKKSGEISQATGQAIDDGAFIPGASAVGEVEYATFSYDNTSIENFNDFFGTTPEKLFYSIDVYSDYDSVGQYSFASEDSYLSITPEIDLSMTGYSNEFIVKDTLDFELYDSEDLEQVIFKIVTDNGIPMIGEVQLYFTDDNYNIIDSMFTGGLTMIANSAPTDADGLSTGKTYTSTEVLLENARVQQILSATQTIIKANFKTPNASNGESVTVKASDNIDIRLGIRAKL